MASLKIETQPTTRATGAQAWTLWSRDKLSSGTCSLVEVRSLRSVSGAVEGDAADSATPGTIMGAPVLVLGMWRTNGCVRSAVAGADLVLGFAVPEFYGVAWKWHARRPRTTLAAVPHQIGRQPLVGRSPCRVWARAVKM